MRGTGAVIHFRPPTDSSIPSPDLSGRWNSIRDWFSLPVQDEAAQCFRVFYQPDEATSPSDRLKNFLKLKALASPGRQDNFTTERILGTGETICMIASGKNSDFPPVTLHLSDQEWHMTQSQEETADCTVLPLSADNPAATTAEESAGASRKGSRITNTQIQAWRDLSPEAKREAGGWKTWAQSQRISISGAKQYLTNTGLTSRGVERLQPPGEKGSSITNAQIQAWRDLPQDAKLEAGGWMKWAQAQGINIKSAGTFLTNSALTPLGTDRLKPPEERGSPITNAQIRTWRDLPQEAKRKAGGWMKWAQALGIDIGSASACLTNTDLTPRGGVRLQPPGERGSPITEAQLLAWLNMSPEEHRAAGGWATWAQTQGISYISARKYLAPIDREIPSSGTSRPPPSATVTSDSPRASTSAATGDEITVSVSEKRSLPSTKEDISAPPAKQIKEEEDDVTWRTHQINNNLPILQHWRDPTISVMAQAEGRIETLQVTRWGPLFNLLSRQTKARINQDIRWFLQNEGKHDARMNAMMSVAIPLDDSDGYRGRTVYARTDLAAFTVLGPYSGRLLDSEKVRCEYEKEYGREAGNYYFATRSQERLVSAWPEGNILSLINSPVFTHRTAETEARQNVSTVLVGKNINFYVTTRDISAGEELWFDYGPDYRHFESGEALRSASVKEEPSSPEEG
ncbi:TPA: SET domain-containing protein [Salmonella enterica]|uniref:SET domain-containing protein n=1 Tax=Salmonella enterica TaxID=28901 RepID=A0A744GLV4_SALER|nr:SET domain-containing protein-lysine N-methyltransferase [Salmonella enterica]ECD0594118.1 SET domain-containing protein-lysine N-methyltransferase [Salmonella enterica subsp. enterica serovar Panama]EDZ8700343.1 SET domain-containing protein [Salmonella enterica subsp. enterica serovar Miami]AXR33171.1 SET domain-containing protein-lysine N-methyltransferase [Salmonella enterica subsp. enterica]EBD6103316.1 SET domain-containing protein [Salmonella enterica]EIJ1116107.1 SET domain-containi